MNTETGKKNLVDNIFSLLEISIVIVAVIAIIFKAYGSWVYIGICALFFLTFIVEPVTRYLKKQGIHNAFNILILSGRCGVLMLFLVSSYKSIFSYDYDLKYTYWIALISFLVIATVPKIQGVIGDYQKRKSQRKKHNILYGTASIIGVLFLHLFMVYPFMSSFIQPVRQISLDDIKIPKTIVFHKRDDSLDFDYRREITSTKDIGLIIEDLWSNKAENITSTDLMNYERLKANNLPCYLMVFDYGDDKNDEKTLENGYIDYITVTSNRKAVIEEQREKGFYILANRFYNAIYPVTLSEETMDMIFSYLE